MNKIFFATTALVVLGGVTAASADVSISGYTRFTHDTNTETQDPDFNLWFKADQTTDTGLKYGGAIRFTPDDTDESGSRHYMFLENEAGKIIMGKHHGPGYTMSLGADWRGTVSAPGRSSYNALQGHTTPRVIYQSPNVGGFQFGASVSSGSETLGAETQTGLNYSMPLGSSNVKLGYSTHNVEPVGMQTSNAKNNEAGIEITQGKFMFSFVSFDRKQSDGFVTNEFQVENGDIAAWCSGRRGYVSVGGDPNGTKVLQKVYNCDFSSFGGGTNHSADISNTPVYFSSDDYLLKFPHRGDDKNGHVFTHTTFESGKKTSGQEFEMAYAVNDGLTLNVVQYSEDDYDRTSIGGKMTLAPGLTASLAHSSIDNDGVDEDSARFRVNYSF